jgi:hypothetical protein
LRGAKLFNVEVEGVRLMGAQMMGGRVCDDDLCTLND